MIPSPSSQPNRLDESRPFKAVRIAVLTVSSTRTEAEDRSGATLVALAQEAGHVVHDKRIVPDDLGAIQTALRTWIEHPEVDVVITTGGTGVTATDVTPEACEALFDKTIPGFGELFRMLSYATIGTSTLQSRCTAGVAGGTYIFVLPGSTGACRDGWDIIKWQLDNRTRPCNLVELMPRLRE